MAEIHIIGLDHRSFRTQLGEHIRHGGLTPERAADAVLAPLLAQTRSAPGLGSDPARQIAKYARPAVLREAEAVARKLESDKIRENRLRRLAERQGKILHKSRRRDPRAVDFGTYWLVEAAGANMCGTPESGVSLASIETHLLGRDPRRPSQMDVLDEACPDCGSSKIEPDVEVTENERGRVFVDRCADCGAEVERKE